MEDTVRLVLRVCLIIALVIGFVTFNPLLIAPCAWGAWVLRPGNFNNPNPGE